MKKFFKIVLFAILTLSLINISDTKINYLNNNNEVEKVKVPRKNAYGDESLINDLTELSNTEWHQSGNLASSGTSNLSLYSNSNTQVKFCDVINYNNENEIREVYSSIPSKEYKATIVYKTGLDADNNMLLHRFTGYEKNTNIGVMCCKLLMKFVRLQYLNPDAVKK